MPDYEGKLGAYRFLPVVFWPYRYNPVTGELIHLVSGDVAVTFATLRTVAAAADSQTNQVFVERMKKMVINPQQASSWYSTRSIAEDEPPSAIPLAIITTSAIVNSSTKLSAYVAHKTNKGFSVTVATEADWGGGTGDAAAEHLRNWLQSNYIMKARYALLIGNPNPWSGDVPMKVVTSNLGSEDGNVPTDYYYADMTGNWDLNGNGFYCENLEWPSGDFGDGGVDRIPEIIVGRIPYYGNMTDLDKILQKIINYETMSSVGNWAQKILIATKPPFEDDPRWQYGEQIVNDTAKPAGLHYYRIYEEDYGLNPPPEKMPCTEDAVKNEWKNGYGFCIWHTHGWPQGAASVFTNSSCSLLNDSKPAFTYQASCSNGYPEATDNLGYMLLLRGAIATVSASRWTVGYSGLVDFTNTSDICGIGYQYAHFLIKERERCGDALFDAKICL
jgi:hypothetical protein